MAVVGTGTKGTKYVKTEWPVDQGLTPGTTKIEGNEIQLVAEDGSNVSRRIKVGLNE